VELGEKYNLPVIIDLGSGVLVDLEKYGLAHEPTVQEQVKKVQIWFVFQETNSLEVLRLELS
jgi:hypothetical protein